MHRFIRNKPFAITLIAVLVLILLVVFTAGSGLSGVSSTVGNIFTPVGSFFSGVTNGVGDLFSSIFGGGSQQRIQELEEKVALLEIQNQNLTDLEAENQRLKDLLGYKEMLNNTTTVLAKVISKSPGTLFNVFVINAGYNQGVRENMAVVNADGLIGCVSEVGGDWSQVITLVDSRSAVSAVVERTRDYGVIQGSADLGSRCKMIYLPAESGTVPGDTVVTSELSGSVPKGIKIGTVTEVTTSDNKLQKTAVIEPAVDFTHIEEALVLISSGSTQAGGDSG